MSGTYALVLGVDAETTIETGALGEQVIEPGGYAYVGSAFGSGGLGRVDRHRRVAAGSRDVRHWHVDYLLGSDAITFAGAVALPAVDCECALARALGDGPIAGFGASDCDCRSHLGYRESVAGMRAAVVEAFQAVDSASATF